MKFNIYDWNDIPILVDIPEYEVNDIKDIIVEIVSGDENVVITFKDGNNYYFNSSDDRLLNFADGWYTVKGTKIEEWMELPKKLIERNDRDRISHERMFYIEREE